MANRRRDAKHDGEEPGWEEQIPAIPSLGEGDGDRWFKEFLHDDLEDCELECDGDIEAILDELVHLSPDYPVTRRRWVLRAWLNVRQERSERHLRQNRQWRLLPLLGITLRGPIAATLQRQLDKLEVEKPHLDRRPPFGNAAAIAAALGLAPLEHELLLLVAMLHLDPILHTALKPLGEFTRRGACAALAAMLGARAEAVHRALLPAGLLARAGLIRVDDSSNYDLRAKLDLLDRLPQLLLGERLDTATLFQHYITPARVSSLTPDDFTHLAEDFDLARRLLAQATATGVAGVNILLYGPPGTGKTEMALALAQAAGVALHTVQASDEDEDPLNARQRLSRYGLAQHLLARRRECALLFDEAGDVLSEGGEMELPFFFTRRESGVNKGWLNGVLEQNQVPTIWIINRIDTIDEAFLRRFDLHIALDIPPRPVRERIIRRHLGELAVSPRWISERAENPHLSPALVQKAARLAQLLPEAFAEQGEALLNRMLDNALTATHYGEPPFRPATVGIADDYDPSLINCDCDLPNLVKGLSRQGQGRICLYGPSGTGKSAFAAWLARTLDRPLLLRTASDLLNSLVGGTEERIARMFQEARHSKAVLLIDEADSFLRGRQYAHQTWEVTQVNELLVRMEQFDGILLCATNRIDDLDAAVRRRFDIKARFWPLAAEQAEHCFCHALSEVGTLPAEGLSDELLTRLWAVGALTLGDFATVRRRASLLGQTLSAELLLIALTEEAALRRRLEE
ncbi:MAG: AAA family ATPase [Candidatus Competibacteraceae bacterium]|uniref:AAA ATPase central domain protein n=1 Tax=Candidatus Contendobacter odensis Run_B_J11 TaxID=1400861 RepID=A0A7U7GCG0_9GAMM|nr:ATP-binding protein [Candidatus Contendobacter odensis]MBK8534859.1 AAA family ATPase [Candidatus Competibacteraceae bacterium]MBK8753495.1 AAA family ATPase [Candidatus Competibacteraceae bacterium]CDH45886.1 putative AAA ATPase central domain protein [Candidatus Contendobacter odensis Run_B_J11]